MTFFKWVMENPYVVTRILLRYLAGTGFANAVISDNDLMLVGSMLVATAAEAGYAVAKKWGGRT